MRASLEKKKKDSANNQSFDSSSQLQRRVMLSENLPFGRIGVRLLENRDEPNSDTPFTVCVPVFFFKGNFILIKVLVVLGPRPFQEQG